jgi:maltose O-acetyltransferase
MAHRVRRRLRLRERVPERGTHFFAPWHFVVNSLAASAWCPERTRKLLYRWAGIECQAHRLRPGLFFFSRRVRFGVRTFVNRDTAFYSEDWIVVGDDCSIGSDVHITTFGHELGPATHRAGALTRSPVRIADGCWIGSRVTILPGVTVGPGCVVAAGAVVTEDCEPNGLYAGVPAVRRREL